MPFKVRLAALFAANTLIRGAMSASGSNALVGFYLAYLARTEGNVDAAVVGWLDFTFNISALLLAIPFGILIDRYSARLVLVTGAFIGAIATQLFGLTGVIAIFFLSRSLEGLSSSAGTAGILAHLTDYSEQVVEQRGKLFSWFEISLFGGLAVGSLISGPLWERFGTGAFAMMSICYVLAGVIYLWGASPVMVPAKQESGGPMFEGLLEVLKNPLLQRLAPAWLAYNAIVGLWLSQVAFQLTGPAVEGQWLVGRFTAPQVSFLAFLYIMIFAAGVFMWGIRLTTMSRVRVMRLSYMAMGGVFFTFLLLNLSSGWALWLRWMVVIVYIVFVFLQSGFPPAALAYLADIAAQTKGRGAAMGVYTLLLSAGNIVGALVGGYFGKALAVNGLIIGTFILAFIGFASLTLLSNFKQSSPQLAEVP